MIKLSKTAWNNVIIFAVMGFILLINATNKNLFSGGENINSEASLLGENPVILTLTINQHLTIERMGKTWRANPKVIKEQPLEQMMLAWQQLAGKVIAAREQLDLQLALWVELEMVGQAQATRLAIFAEADELVIFNQQSKQWFSLPLQLYSQLLPDAVINY